MLISAYYGSMAAGFGAPPAQDQPWSDGTGWTDG